MYSKRGAELKVIDGYKLRFHKFLANEVERWVCTQKNCKTYMKVRSGRTLESDLHHNHPRDSDNRLMRQVVANACKRKAANDMFERPSKLMCREMSRAALEVLSEGDRVQIRKSIHSARAKLRPPLPKDLNELHRGLQSYIVQTKLAENFMLVNDDVNNIVMFSTEKNLQFLVTCEFLLMDGTFYSAPSLFTQIFIIFGKKKCVHVPLVFILLTSKEEAAYEHALRKLTVFLPQNYTPRTVYVDFEEAIHSAVRHVWPSSVIQGCRFHLGQSWYRRIQFLGLAKTYRSNTAAGSYLRAYFGLAFMDPNEVEDFFVNELTPTEPRDDKQIKTFRDYVYNNYIHTTARFPPSVWAKYSPDIGRTTNACESLNSKLNGMFYHAHPNIYSLIDALLELQERNYAKMLSVSTKKLSKKRIAKEAFIRETMEQYERGAVSQYDYVKILSRKFMPKKCRK